ncbi:CLUMA_CG019692, isoform A [Clunio marinus]|uniref:CLUMA_CG019692, isoform A n=1 Tax=Clunio marinus TaxID=568069 RepID=A0A1J1J5H7_9DIPT|nr:CLUMA_CG019692, isoform A [Clunio marinus]
MTIIGLAFFKELSYKPKYRKPSSSFKALEEFIFLVDSKRKKLLVSVALVHVSNKLLSICFSVRYQNLFLMMKLKTSCMIYGWALIPSTTEVITSHPCVQLSACKAF